MSSLLLVPIHLDALVLPEDKLVVEAVADFSRLPYCDEDEKADINPDIANISEEIVSPPFQNQNLLLKAGIHLHWSLPDALTRARHTQSGQDFPPVPNRWLVTRCNNGGEAKEWIVESDYLYPEKTGDQFGSGITVPSGQSRPFRYMGRTMAREQWSEIKSQNNLKAEEYYPKLTVIGYGEPTFAAFYPNCHSVFGFHDPDSQREPAGSEYYVIGWYSDPAQDYLGAFINALPPEVKTNEARIKALEDDFKWTLKLDEMAAFPQQMLCYAKIVIGEEAEGDNVDDPTTIAIGNTGTEALSAYLAETLSSESKNIIEEQLEALQLSAKLEHRQLDIGSKFLEARHEKGFIAIPGGSLWTIRPESITSSAADVSDAQAEITLPDEMAHLLNAVNDRQQKYDRGCQEIESLRRQLFSDWYKYMLCAYPPEDARDEYPNIDEVKSFIEANVEVLNKRIALTGTLRLTEQDGKFNASVDSSPESLATKLAQAINDLQKSVDGHNLNLGDTKSLYRLKQISGPRYWQPTEPVVLIKGSIVEASDRHGQDGRESDGLLETQIFQVPADLGNAGEQNWSKQIRVGIDGHKAINNFAFSNWTAQPWNPFLLEWEVEVFPIESGSNLNTGSGSYAADFISDNYTVSENEVDLSLRLGKGSTTRAANVYSGRSILTPHAGIQLKKQIEAYLNKEVLPQYYQAQQPVIPIAQQNTAYLDQHIKDIQTWYETTNAATLKTPQSKDGDPCYTAIRAYEALKDLDCLSQSLGGFNEALLMHKQTMQLAIGDPLGFDDYQDFAGIVRNAVSNSIYSVPEPLNDFNPIRSGAMKILQLRLVDTFGQIKDLEIPGEVITSEPMTISDGDFHIRLAPRLVQPARINFRWLAAEGDEQEMNDHPTTTPICGWVLTNNLDNSLMIYDNKGKALGSLDENAEWEPAPGSFPQIDKPEHIGNAHLRKMVERIRDCGTGFLERFISAVDNALENIEPENFAQHQDIALLMGRPIALVRAAANLELQGLPATHQGWNEFRQDMERDTREDNDFSEVTFPIRIGDYKQFNDGVVGFWKEDIEADKNNWFFAPQSDDEQEITDERIKTHRTAVSDATNVHELMTIPQSVNSAPQILSMLIDPRGLVHATSGVLPAKAISIPPDQYADALQDIEITFLSTPILTDVGKINLPLPAEAGYQWSWLQQGGQKAWTEVSSRGIVQKDVFAGFQSDADVWNVLIVRGWIAIDPNDKTRASVIAKDQRQSPSLPDNLKDKTAEIEDILDRAHIGPINPTAKFSGPQEIREGWLKLSVDKSQPSEP